jgi:acetyl esterase/lipase
MNFIRIIFAFVLLLFSLLAIFKAPTNLLWKCSILITEYSYLFILLAGLSTILCGSSEWQGKISAMALFVAMLLFSTPLLRAIPVILKLPQDLQNAFKKQTHSESEKLSPSPFNIRTYIFGISKPHIRFKSITYKHKENGVPLDLIYYPALKTNKKAPCVIVIHGGGWDGGDRFQLPELNVYLASKGYNVASIDYRLAPEYQFPAPIEDTKDAIAKLKQESLRLNIDTNNFILLGRSAGGQIALITAYKNTDPCIKGVISFYAPADMIWGYSIPGNPLILDSRKVMENYLGGTIQKVPEHFKAASPNEFVNPACPPTLLIHGMRDEMVAYEHSIRLKNLLNKAGVKNYLLTLPWATHGCDYNFHGQSAQLSTFAIERFLNTVVVH